MRGICMKIQIASDLHIEQMRKKVSFGGLVDGGADVLVLAGDIDKVTSAVARFSLWRTPVIYVLGNHEYYGGKVDEVELRAKVAATAGNVVVLTNDVFELGDVRFVGSTLWTDFRLNRAHHKAMAQARAGADHSCIIARSGGGFSPDIAAMEHRDSVKWLEQTLRQRRRKTIVVTHHAPHERSLPEQSRRRLEAASFASDLSRLIPLCDLWIHGHVHSSSDYWQCGRKIICNPRGRPVDGGATGIHGTNASFRPSFVYELF